MWGFEERGRSLGVFTVSRFFFRVCIDPVSLCIRWFLCVVTPGSSSSSLFSRTGSLRVCPSLPTLSPAPWELCGPTSVSVFRPEGRLRRVVLLMKGSYSVFVFYGSWVFPLLSVPLRHCDLRTPLFQSVATGVETGSFLDFFFSFNFGFTYFPSFIISGSVCTHFVPCICVVTFSYFGSVFLPLVL